MKLATFKANNRTRLGAIIDDNKIIIDLEQIDRRLARREKRKMNTFLSSMVELLEAGNKGLRTAKSLITAAENLQKKPDEKISFNVNRIKLLAPVPSPKKVFCLAGNYQDHIEEGGSAKLSIQDKETPRVFMKPPTTTVIGPKDKILIPPIGNSIDWEGELAVVIGRKCKGVKASDALKYVAGYTIMNDVSERDLKIKKRTDSRPRDEWFDWLNGKWLDTFAPQGPWIVTRDEIPNPQSISSFNKNMRFAVFKQKHFYYKMNFQSQINPFWYGSRICVKKFLKSPQWLRNIKIKKRNIFKRYLFNMNYKIIAEGGWHFSNIKSPEKIIEKTNAFCHGELNQEKFKKKDLIKNKIDQLKDIYDRDIKYEKIEIDNSYPEYFIKNLNHYREWLI